MRRLIVALMMLPLAALGCSAREPLIVPPPPDSDEADVIDAASARWFHATGLNTDVRAVRVDGDCDAVMGPPASAHHTYWGCWSGEDRTITLDVRTPRAARYLVLSHEFGHSLGASHSDHGSVMAALVSERPTCLSRADVDAVCDGRTGGCRWRHPECE